MLGVLPDPPVEHSSAGLLATYPRLAARRNSR